MTYVKCLFLEQAASPSHVDNKGLIVRDFKQKGTDSYFAGTPQNGVRYVISRVVTKTTTGRRRPLTVLSVKRALLHIDALIETYVEPPHLRDTERCQRLKKCMYGTVTAAAGWQHIVQKIGADNGLLSSRTCLCAFRRATRDLDMNLQSDWRGLRMAVSVTERESRVGAESQSAAWLRQRSNCVEPLCDIQ